LAWLARRASVTADAGYRTGTAPVSEQSIAVTRLPHTLTHQAFDFRAPGFDRQRFELLRHGRVVIMHGLIRQSLRQTGCTAQQGCQIGQGGYTKHATRARPGLKAAQQLRQQRGRGRLKAHLEAFDQCCHRRLTSMTSRSQYHRIASE